MAVNKETTMPISISKYILFMAQWSRINNTALHFTKNDGALKVFINTKGTVGDVSEEFKELMYFLDTSEIKEYNTELFNDMADALQDARTNEKWRHDYMSIEMLKFDCREEGRQEEKRENALRMLKKGLEALFVAECVDLPLNEVQALAATL